MSDQIGEDDEDVVEIPGQEVVLDEDDDLDDEDEDLDDDDQVEEVEPPAEEPK